MSLDKIKQMVGSLAKSVDDNEKLATPVLAMKIAKALKTNPHDQTLGAMSRVIGKMEENNSVFIRKGEFKTLYNKLYSRNTKFAELFAEELGIVEAPVVEIKKEEFKEMAAYEPQDSVLASALHSIFNNEEVKTYATKVGEKAKNSVNYTLDSWNLKPSKTTVAEGNEKFLVIKADYETPKGITSFYVPVQVEGNKILEASVFMGNTGLKELNHTNLKSYLTTFAGSKLKVSANGILEVLTNAASENREVSDTELALTRLNASRQVKADFFEGQIVGQKIDSEGVKDVELPKAEGFESFEKEFGTDKGLASFKFGDKVKVARDVIARDLVSYGHKNPQIAVTGNDDSTIFYSVALDGGKVAFTVPVKVVGDKVNKPGLMLCNGVVSTFNQEGINELYINNQADFKAAAAASPQFGLKSSDLINNIRSAINESNHSKAEDALNVLANAGDEKAYAIGFDLFLKGLGGKKAEATVKCAMVLKSSTSEHPVCGHTGLPVHKVYQDKDGNCRPLYRRGMDESYECGTFMNAKIFG